MFYVQDFEDSITNASDSRNDEHNQTVDDSIPHPLKCFVLNCGFPVVYIAFDYGRIAVATVRATLITSRYGAYLS